MMAILQGESQCDPNAANTTDVHKDIYGNVICIGSYGLLQISCHGGQIYDPAENIRAGYVKYQTQGLEAWGAYTDGRYLKYYQGE